MNILVSTLFIAILLLVHLLGCPRGIPYMIGPEAALILASVHVADNVIRHVRLIGLVRLAVAVSVCLAERIYFHLSGCVG